MVRFCGACCVNRAASSRSISKAITRPAVSVNRVLMAPRPGPISTIVSSAAAPIAVTTFTAHAGSRKCWPKRFFGRGVRDCVAPSGRARRCAPRSVTVLRVPVAILDLLDLLFAHAEVVADLVDERLADRDHQVVLVLGLALVGSLKEQDAVGQRVAVVPSALG